MITANQVMEAISGQRMADNHGIIITEFVIDSRKAIPGSLFLALQGERSDGHQFIENAFQSGARIAIIEKDRSNDFPVIDLRESSNSNFEVPKSGNFCIRVDDSMKALQKIAKFWRSKLEIRVIGITGSVGKSSTKELTFEVLSRRFATFKNPGNYNNEIGLPLTILNTGSGFQKLILEMGFYYPGEIKFLCNIASPEIGIVTNIGTVHASRAGSQDEIAKGKSELVNSLPPAPLGTAILNFDDPLVRKMADLTDANIVYYGLDKNADIWADEIASHGLEGIQFRLHYQGNSARISVPMLGRHSVQTILRASAVGFIEGMNWEEIIEGLTSSNTQLRLVAVETKSGALILDDTYNATPESTIAALDLLGEIGGNKIAVLGDMLELGKYEETGHAEVGKKASVVADHIIAVGERSQTIAQTAKEYGSHPASVSWVENTDQAIGLLRDNLKSGDVVLIKGSHGMRLDRITSELEAII